jgi:cadmium resistance protein CadD (predicted permease)
MEWLLATLQIALAAGVATTFDDNIYLTGFFGAVNRRLQPRHIVVGELLGFTLLLLISLAGYAIGLALPKPMLGLLGILPILIGLRTLWEQWQLFRQPTAPPRGPWVRASELVGFASEKQSLLSTLSDPQTYRVSLVTMANGSNNLSIYIPLFASLSLAKILVMIPVFYALIASWLLLSFHLTKAPLVALALNRYMPSLFPFLLLWLGIRILHDSGTLVWLGLG